MATWPERDPVAAVGGDRPFYRRRRGIVAVVGVVGVATAVVIAVAVFGSRSTPARVNVTASGAFAGEGTSTTSAPAPSTTEGGGTASPGHTVVGSAAPTTLVPARPPSAVSTPPSTAPTTTTATVPPGSGTTTLTAADSGQHYTLRRGDRLVVNLTGPALYTWTEATTSDVAVLPRTAASSGGTATAAFVAAADGQSTVSATANPNCYPRCLPPSRLFQVTISVTG